MAYEQWRKDLLSNFDETVEWRRYMHEYPELSFEEVKTADYIKSVLEDIGVDQIRENVGNGYGIVARIKGAHEGPTVAFRADFDALAITEQANVPFRSKNPGVMHACGHDGHTASLLSLGRVMANNRDQMYGDVVLIHQHAEEMIPGGAKSMVEDGALENVDYVFGIHLDAQSPNGQVYYQPNFGSANADFFDVFINIDEENSDVDLLAAAMEYLSSSQKIVSRMVSPTRPAVVTYSTVEMNQETKDKVPTQVHLKGTVRTLHQSTREQINQELQRIAEGLSTAFQVKAEVNYNWGYPSIKNHATEVSRSLGKFSEVFSEDEISETPVGMGGEDFSYFIQEIPGAFFRVGAAYSEDEKPFPHHHPRFVIDEDSLLRSGEVFLAICDEYIGKPQK